MSREIDIYSQKISNISENIEVLNKTELLLSIHEKENLTADFLDQIYSDTIYNGVTVGFIFIVFLLSAILFKQALKDIYYEITEGRDSEFSFKLLLLVANFSEIINESIKINTIVAEQLDGVSDTTEKAAINIMTNVGDIDIKVGELSYELESLVKIVNVIKLDGDSEIDSVKDSLDEMSNYMNIKKEELSHHKDKIDDVMEKTESLRSLTELVKNIASQTNLLALNAAIEAARAGENGRGFAVVADEVRKLSSESDKAAEEIQRGIETLLSTVEMHMGSMMKGYSSSDVSRLEGFSKQLESVVDINSRYDEFSDNMTAILSERVESISYSVSNTLGSVQFQDITRQRLELVQNVSTQLNDYYTNFLSNMDDHDKLIALEPFTSDNFLANYHMEEQRTAHNKAAGIAISKDDNQPAIQLF